LRVISTIVLRTGAELAKLASLKRDSVRLAQRVDIALRAAHGLLSQDIVERLSLFYRVPDWMLRLMTRSLITTSTPNCLPGSSARKILQKVIRANSRHILNSYQTERNAALALK
jgi:hypothetical protein